MCLIVFAYNVHEEYKLILAANRDEFFNRPAIAAAYQDGGMGVLCGIDSLAGGTWIGVNKRGRFAAITNYRNPNAQKQEAVSRGSIAYNFLHSQHTIGAMSGSILASGQLYNGFNFLCGDTEVLAYISNVKNEIQVVEKGVHTLSNAFLDTPWHKTERARNSFGKIIQGNLNNDEFLSMLGDTSQSPEEFLPDTGVSREIEKALSANFIRINESYGTRCSTILKIRNDDVIFFDEFTYSLSGAIEHTEAFTFAIDKPNRKTTIG